MCLTWLIDKILQHRDLKNGVRVFVHEGLFFNDPKREPYYFVQVTNLSHTSSVIINRVWVKDSLDLEISNFKTPLPYELKKTGTWETWFKKDLISDTENIFDNVRVVLSSGKEYKSERNINVMPSDFSIDGY